MAENTTVQLQSLIDRLRRGDAAAQRELLERAQPRLVKLAGAILRRSFPNLAQRHEVESALHNAWLKIAMAVEKAKPETVSDFFGLAGHKIRQTLLDMVADEKRQFAGKGADSGEQPFEPNDSTLDPAKLELWREFHEKVQSLDDQERLVFEMHYYLGMPQSEIALVLDLHARKVSYIWISATEKLIDALPGPIELD